MLAPHDHGNILDAILDEPVSPPGGPLVRGKQLLITKDSHLVLHVSFHGVQRVSPDYHAFLPGS